MKSAQSVCKPILSLGKVFVKTSKTFLFSVLIGVLGAILCLTPLGLSLEEEFGLAWLFSVRGDTPPPPDVVIISIDQSSAEALKFDDNPDKWPRENYVRLLQKINRQQPAIIALDIVFKDDRDPLIDQQLADAVAQNGNVVLSNYLKHKMVPMSGNATAVSYESVVESIDSVSSAALAAAPFLLPKTASTVKEFWINKNSAGDLRTFPDAVFQCYVFKTAYTEIITLLKGFNPTMAAQLPDSFAQLASEQSILDTVEQIQAEFMRQNSPDKWMPFISAAQFPAKQTALLNAWLKVLDNKSLYLNHYGNVGAITTIPFYQAIKDLPPDSLRDKVVVIGYSESIEPEKNPGFYSVFSKANNQTISSAEIAATAIGNLIGNSWLAPLELGQQFSLVLAWGILLSAFCLLCSYRLAMGLILLSGGIFIYAAYYQFVTAHLWLPLIIPIALQMPLIIIGLSILHFHHTDRAKHKMQSVLRTLLPKDIVETLPYPTTDGVMDTSAKSVQGICMATDICDYTQLSETIAASELHTLMKAYYKMLFPVVAHYHGYVTDLAGDGMYAVWPNPKQTQQAHSNACHAALQINSSLSELNKSLKKPLITRIGLSCGEISIGHTGAPGRYVYHAMGDPVNTASRVEGLNKHLGTRILVTATMAEDLHGFLFRDLGLFRLKGKTKPVHVLELMAAMTGNDGAQQKLITAFALALGLFQQQQWALALEQFRVIRKNFPDDGPSQFFIDYLSALASAQNPVVMNTPVIIDIK